MKKNRTFSSLKPIRSLLPESIKKLIKNTPSTDYDSLKKSWQKVLGEEIAKKCELIKIKEYSKKKRCIFLKVERKFLIEVDYARDEIIKKINSFYGFESINKVLINIEDINSTQPNEKSLKLSKKTEDMIKVIDDSELRDKLLNFSNKKKNENN